MTSKTEYECKRKNERAQVKQNQLSSNRMQLDRRFLYAEAANA